MIQVASTESRIAARFVGLRRITTGWYPEIQPGPPFPEAWRVCVLLDDGVYADFVQAFAREKDAVAAKNALDAAGITDEHKIRAAGREITERTMAEAMAW